MIYNTSSDGKLKLYLMHLVCVMIRFIIWTRKFVDFGDKTNDVMTKQKLEKYTILLSFL